MNKLYARYPVIFHDEIYFTSGNEILKTKIKDQDSNPVIAYLGSSIFKYLTKADDKIACVSYEESGPDIYLFDPLTQNLERITYFESSIIITKFENGELYFLSNKNSHFHANLSLYKINLATLKIEDCGLSPISWFDFNEQRKVIQKAGYGYLNWKGYKGGTKGRILASENDDKFEDIISLPHNALRPFLYENQCFFIYEENKQGNVFQYNFDTKQLEQITFFDQFQTQDLMRCENYLIYTNMGNIYIYDILKKKQTALHFKIKLIHDDLKKEIIQPQAFLTCIDAKDQNFCAAIKGMVFKGNIYSGGVKKLTSDLRYIHTGFFGNKIFAIKEPPESKIIIFDEKNNIETETELDTGKISLIKNSDKWLCYLNHRHELVLFNFETKEKRIIVPKCLRINGFDIAGNYIVYSESNLESASTIKIYDIENNKHHQITSGQFYDIEPCFDKAGNFIAFITNAYSEIENDGIRFNLHFNHKKTLNIIYLKKDINLLQPWTNEKIDEKSDDKDDDKNNSEKKSDNVEIKIDFDEFINFERIPLNFVNSKIFQTLHTTKDGKIIATYKTRQDDDEEEEEKPTAKIFVDSICLKTLFKETIYKNLSSFFLTSSDQVILAEDQKIKIHKLGEKDESGYKKNSQINFERFKFFSDPNAEWQQMAQELCYFLKEFYWSEKNNGMNLDKILEKYKEPIKNIRTKEELFDIMNEIQGELSTSHSYIYDQFSYNVYNRGYLGARFEYQENEDTKNGYVIKEIYDSSFEDNMFNPLKIANANIKVGDILLEIDGVKLDLINSPEKLLSNKNEISVSLKIQQKDEIKEIDVVTLSSESKLIYRTWINKNRKFVHEATHNKIGYVHIPDMSKTGFQEFFKAYLNEFSKDGLIIDVRNNRGGNISTLILDQIKRIRKGTDKTRWHGNVSIPHEAAWGNYVLLINESTASDGELFSHQFKMNKLGTIIGKRTWGGVVGIMPRYSLIDNTLTSQPEFATWFNDIGYELENHGIEPEIEVENSLNSRQDVQLETAVKIASKFNIPDNEDKINNHKIY